MFEIVLKIYGHEVTLLLYHGPLTDGLGKLVEVQVHSRELWGIMEALQFLLHRHADQVLFLRCDNQVEKLLKHKKWFRFGLSEYIWPMSTGAQILFATISSSGESFKTQWCNMTRLSALGTVCAKKGKEKIRVWMTFQNGIFVWYFTEKI